MREYLLVALCFLPICALAQTYVKVGPNSNQIHVIDNQAFIIGGMSPYQPKLLPSYSVVDLKSEKTETIVQFPKDWSLYRAALIDNKLYTSIWNRNQIVEVDLKRDLQSSQFKHKRAFYTEPFDAIGMESVVQVGGQIWVAYSNLQGVEENGTFGPGHISIIENGVKVNSLKTETPNPKRMITTDDGLVIVSVGVYNKWSDEEGLIPADDGQIIVINPEKMKNLISPTIRTNQSSEFYRIFNVGGTPDDMFYDKENKKIYSCDLDYGAKRFFEVDLVSGNVQTHYGDFENCGAIFVEDSKIYVAHFNGADQSGLASDKHLYVYDRETKKEVCSQSFLPGRLRQPSLLFPNDLEVYNNGWKKKLIVSFGVYPYLGILDLDNQGIPEGCH